MKYQFVSFLRGSSFSMNPQKSNCLPDLRSFTPSLYFLFNFLSSSFSLTSGFNPGDNCEVGYIAEGTGDIRADVGAVRFSQRLTLLLKFEV